MSLYSLTAERSRLMPLLWISDLYIEFHRREFVSPFSRTELFFKSGGGRIDGQRSLWEITFREVMNVLTN